jgi:hypothetical protein
MYDDASEYDEILTTIVATFEFVHMINAAAVGWDIL